MKRIEFGQRACIELAVTFEAACQDFTCEFANLSRRICYPCGEVVSFQSPEHSNANVKNQAHNRLVTANQTPKQAKVNITAGQSFVPVESFREWPGRFVVRAP